MNIVDTPVTIPTTSYMTLQMVVDYLGIPKTTVQSYYRRAKSKLDELGSVCYNVHEFENVISRAKYSKKKVGRILWEYVFDNGVDIVISVSRTLLFPKEAVDYMKAYFHSHSDRKPYTRSFARPEVVVEADDVLKDKQVETNRGITFRSPEEKRLCIKLAKAFATGDTMKVLSAAVDLDSYRIQEIDRLSTLVSEAEKSLISWTERSSSGRIVKTLAGILEQTQTDIWNKIYYKLTCEYKIPLESRGVMPLIDALENREWHMFYKAVSEICESKCIDIKKLCEKAGVNYNGLSVMLGVA